MNKKYTNLELAVARIIHQWKYFDLIINNYVHEYQYKFIKNERACCLRLERKGLVKRTDKIGNYFKLTAKGLKHFGFENA